MRRAPQKRPTKPFSSTGVAQPSARFTSAPATPDKSSFTNLTPPTVILSALCTRFMLPSSAPLSAPGESAATRAGSGATAAPFAYCFYDLANLAWSADRSGLPWAAKWEAWDWNSAKRPWANREQGFGTAEPGFGTARLARWTQAYWVSPDVQPPY